MREEVGLANWALGLHRVLRNGTQDRGGKRAIGGIVVADLYAGAEAPAS